VEIRKFMRSLNQLKVTNIFKDNKILQLKGPNIKSILFLTALNLNIKVLYNIFK